MDNHDCIFCKIANNLIPSKAIYEDDYVKVIMDVNPVVDGHALVIPKKHYTDFLSLDLEIRNHIMNVANDLAPKFMEKLGSTGITLLVNYGDTQEVKHFHLHLLPDYCKETVDHLKRSIDENYAILKD